MNTKERFFEAFDYLKKAGKIRSLTELASKLHTNKAGISDLKAGRKKIALEHLKYLNISYPEINIERIITGKGEILRSEEKQSESNPKDIYIIELQQKRIEALEKELKELKKELKKAYDNMATDVERKLKKHKRD